MKRYVFFCFSFILVTVCFAQGKKFSPEKFDAEMTAYITKEVRLTDGKSCQVLPPAS